MKSAIKLSKLFLMALLLFCLTTTYVMAAVPVSVSSDISPTTAYTNNNLTGACTVTDADNDTITYSYIWYVNDTNVSTSETLSSGNFSRDDEIILSCKGNDGTDNSSWINSTTLTISNTLPVANTASISPATAYTDSTLVGTCSVTDLDGDDVTTYYTWYVNGIEVSLVQNLTSGNFTIYDEVILSCNGNDDEGYSDSLNSTTKTITFNLSVSNTEFDDTSNTNFSAVSDMSSISNAVIGKSGVGKITYSTLDASYDNTTITLDLDSAIEIGDNSIYLNASALPAGFNTTATLTFYGLEWDAEPIVLVDGSECTECTINSYALGVLSVTVPHFSTYTTIAGLGEDAADSCQSTRNTMFAAFAIIALFFIVGAGFALTKVFSEGGTDSGLFIGLVVAFIALAIVLMVGFIIISNVALSVCGV